MPGIEFAISPLNGTWQAEIPLEPGDNPVQITVLDSIGQRGSVSANIERRAAAVIDLRVDSPRDGAVVTEPSVVFSGRVISEVPIDPPQVVVNSQAASVSQGDIATEYTFQSPVISLNEGNNVVTVWTLAGSKSIQKTVLVSYQPEPERVEPPLITIRSPQPGSTQNTDSFTFTADIYSTIGLKTVTLNGEAISPVSGNLVQEVIGFAEGETAIDLTLSVTDNLDQVSTHRVRYLRDTSPPEIQVEGLAAFPQENTVTENPYLLSGSVSDPALSQLLINDQAVGLTPTATLGTYRFQVPLALTAGAAQSVVVSAIDAGGNRSQQDYLLALLNNIGIEWISPQDDRQILIDGSAPRLDISARVSNLSGNEQLIAYFEGREGEAISLTVAQGLLSASIPLPDTEGSYTLWLEVRDGSVLARASRNLILKAAAAVPLQVLKVTPADGAQNVEANAFVSVLFNKPIELAKLSLALHETVHGYSYIDSDPPGVDGLIARGYVLQNINRDYQAVPGVLSLLPDASGVTFYPERDLGYGADLYLSVTYDGVDMVRQQAKIRPRPTFIEGIVVDNLGQPVAGIEVAIPALARSTRSNADGAYSFGYGDSAERNIPSGRYPITVNAGLKDPRFGSHRGWINVQTGTRNTPASIQLALANPDMAISPLQSGVRAVLNGGEVILDFSDSRLSFPDGRPDGAIRLQFQPLTAVSVRSFDARYTPLWLYAVQPAGIEVEGDTGLDFALPTYQGSHDYAPREGERVVLLGLNADATALAPVGVGEAIPGPRIKRVGATRLSSLDYLGYARVIPDQQADLDAYANGDIDLETLQQRLQTYRFIPPQNETEAAERLQ